MSNDDTRLCIIADQRSPWLGWTVSSRAHVVIDHSKRLLLTGKRFCFDQLSTWARRQAAPQPVQQAHLQVPLEKHCLRHNSHALHLAVLEDRNWSLHHHHGTATYACIPAITCHASPIIYEHQHLYLCRKSWPWEDLTFICHLGRPLWKFILTNHKKRCQIFCFISVLFICLNCDDTRLNCDDTIVASATIWTSMGRLSYAKMRPQAHR